MSLTQGSSVFEGGYLTIVAGIVVLATLPLLVGQLLASEIVLFAIFVLGYNILLGYGGEMSFGHAAFFGLGAYGTILTYHYLIPDLFVSILVGIMAATVAGVVIGRFSLQRRGIYFSMITLAFAQMVYIVFFQATDITGGSNGISFPPMEGYGPLNPGSGGFAFYVVAVAVFGIIFLSIRRIINSPFGRVLVAVRENSDRAAALGYDVRRILLVAFIFTSVVSGLAGSLFAVLFAFASPNVLFWLTSGEVVLMTIIGGAGTLGGPLIGAIIYKVLSDSLTDFFNFWEIPFGMIIVLVVIFAPEGVYGVYRNYVTGEAGGFGARRIFRRLMDDISERLGR